MREMGLGPATGRAAVKLAAARARARQLHAAVREGCDPLAERHAAAAKAKSDAAKIAFTWEAGELRLWVNGIKVGTIDHAP